MWLRDDETGERWLFKPRGQHSDGSTQIGDWVEWVSAAVGASLKIPTASIRLGTRNGTFGCLSRHVTPSNAWDMQSGRLWLHNDRDVSYSSTAASMSRRERGASPGYTLGNIRTSLSQVQGPPGSPSAVSAWDAFVGYMFLDALTSNRDRHEENWSIMRPLRGEIVLAPTYDLENGLGFQLRDAKRAACLADPAAMDQFVARGTATRFDGEQRTSLVDLAVGAIDSCSPAGQQWLGGIVTAASRINFADLVVPASGVSDVAVSFAQVLLGTNVRRMQHAYSAR